MKSIKWNILNLVFLTLALAACSGVDGGDDSDIIEDDVTESTNDSETSADIDANLPGTITWSTYDTGAAGYVQSATFGETLNEHTGTTLRSVPAGNDVARLSPLVAGDVDFTLTGVGSILAFEGRYEFSNEDWGPQDLRALWMGIGDQSQGINTAADADIDTVNDLEGKRVAYIAGAPSLNLPVEAFLAYADITWDDVEQIEFPSLDAALDGMIQGQVDALYSGSHVPQLEELAASNRGFQIAEVPHDDSEGWERLQEVAPWLEPHEATLAAAEAASPENPVETASSPYPILVTMDDQDEELVYELTKQIHLLYEEYTDDFRELEAWHVDNLMMPFSVPYHEGTIRYLREIDVWTEEDDEWNDQLIENHAIAQDHYEEFMNDVDDGLSDEEIAEEWEQERDELLED